MPMIEWLWRGWLALMITLASLSIAQAVTDAAAAPAVPRHPGPFDQLVPPEAFRLSGFTA